MLSSKMELLDQSVQRLQVLNRAADGSASKMDAFETSLQKLLTQHGALCTRIEQVGFGSSAVVNKITDFEHLLQNTLAEKGEKGSVQAKLAQAGNDAVLNKLEADVSKIVKEIHTSKAELASEVKSASHEALAQLIQSLEQARQAGHGVAARSGAGPHASGQHPSASHVSIPNTDSANSRQAHQDPGFLMAAALRSHPASAYGGSHPASAHGGSHVSSAYGGHGQTLSHVSSAYGGSHDLLTKANPQPTTATPSFSTATPTTGFPSLPVHPVAPVSGSTTATHHQKLASMFAATAPPLSLPEYAGHHQHGQSHLGHSRGDHHQLGHSRDEHHPHSGAAHAALMGAGPSLTSSLFPGYGVHAT